jgi:two-component sensor histidine kinase
MCVCICLRPRRADFMITTEEPLAVSGEHRLPLRTFLIFIATFWIYLSIMRLAQWELMRGALRTSSGLDVPTFILTDALLLPVLIVLSLVSRRVGYDLSRWRIRVPAHFALAIVFGLCGRPAMIIARAIAQDMPLAESFAITDGPDLAIALKMYGSMTVDFGLAYVFLQGLVTGYAYFERFRHEQVLRERLQAQYERARLHALRMQINPHFLYNTLSAIAGLVRANPDAAENMVTRLGELFRRVLSDRNAEFVALQQELEHGEQYLHIQHARFEDRMAYRMTVAPGLEGAAIPPLLLQPLLENAVEHGLGSTAGAVRIEVECQAEDAEVALTVRNIGEQPLSTRLKRTHGYGLRSVSERLDAAFGPSSSFVLVNPAPGHYEARLRFPRRQVGVPFKSEAAA